MKLPRHAHVANAIGAVVGRITIRHTAAVTSPAEGKFRAHLEEGPEDFTSADAAMARVEEVLLALARGEAEMAGLRASMFRRTALFARRPSTGARCFWMLM